MASLDAELRAAAQQEMAQYSPASGLMDPADGGKALSCPKNKC
jgi:hypothetical protein